MTDSEVGERRAVASVAGAGARLLPATLLRLRRVTGRHSLA